MKFIEKLKLDFHIQPIKRNFKVNLIKKFLEFWSNFN